MKRKNLTLFFEYFQMIHFDKDPFLVPYYLGLALDYDVKILYPSTTENADLPSSYRGVELIPFKVYGTWKTHPLIRYRKVYSYLRKNACKIDVFMRFFLGRKSEWTVLIYKHYNPTGKVYVKMDINPYNIPQDIKWYEYLVFPFCKWWHKLFIRNVDVASCETTLAYSSIMYSKRPEHQFGDKLVLVPNGVDEQTIRQLGFTKSDPLKKEKILMTVGRLGKEQKNTEMLLEALEKVDLKDWRFYFVGSIEETFEIVRQNFVLKHPELKNNVVWTGEMTDRKLLYELYNKSRGLILSSRFESFAIVFVEANRFSNYIISTPVGAVNDVIKGGLGEIVETVDEMAAAIQRVIDGKTNTDVYVNSDISFYSWASRIEIVKNKLI